MLYRLLGKFFFLFYICPRINREFRMMRKHFVPIINAKITALVEKEKENAARSRRDHPAGTRRPE